MAKRITMTALEMQQELLRRGYQTEIRFRKEGGARISKINGVSYVGSKGNVEARKILGQSLTEAQQRHLKEIEQKKGVFGKNRKEPIPDELLRLQNKANRAFKKKGQTARVTRKKIRARLERDGYQETKAYIERVIRHAKDYVYEESLTAYLVRLQNDRNLLSLDGNTKTLSKLDSVISKVQEVISNGSRLLENDFAQLLDITYMWEDRRLETADFSRMAISILNKAE